MGRNGYVSQISTSSKKYALVFSKDIVMNCEFITFRNNATDFFNILTRL
jgi:hypothetical protein